MTNKEINIIDNFLTEEECDNFIQRFKNGESLDTEYVRVKIENLLKEHYKFKGFELKNSNPVLFNEYTVETKYSLEWEINDKSYFTVIIQLNDNFKNGLQQFLVGDGENYFQVPKNTGNIVIFFSNLKKRLAPVEIGFRYTLETEIELIESINQIKTLL
jgi:hypothetical protein